MAKLFHVMNHAHSKVTDLFATAWRWHVCTSLYKYRWHTRNHVHENPCMIGAFLSSFFLFFLLLLRLTSALLSLQASILMKAWRTKQSLAYPDAWNISCKHIPWPGRYRWSLPATPRIFFQLHHIRCLCRMENGRKCFGTFRWMLPPISMQRWSACFQLCCSSPGKRRCYLHAMFWTQDLCSPKISHPRNLSCFCHNLHGNLPSTDFSENIVFLSFCSTLKVDSRLHPSYNLPNFEKTVMCYPACECVFRVNHFDQPWESRPLDRH